ncbi:hypothetical protein EHQ94_03825 [Leptospira meyeri]|uniref:hypothetical protein n=1 Tax=Leptospira meyeri TaxID=29508 RepID=UPI0010832E6F|nr:hypothetical protein [Leptospira meyeri]TGM62543.1 hypothetical protein EHQ93_14770 [Leptospira meyeri]TGM71152.1 hypothetical protein EHQ94_03825 [Leptospira meyeri]
MWKIKYFSLIIAIFLFDFQILHSNPAIVFSALNIAVNAQDIKGNRKYIKKALPISNHENTYFIVKVMGENKENLANRYSYNFVFGESRFKVRFFYFDHAFHSSVIPYLSIQKSIYYRTYGKLNQQNSISEFCNNYIPIQVGEFFYEFSLYDDRRYFDLPHYDNFYLHDYFKVEANKSVYIEVDIKNDSYTSKMINTPEDIFSDMCQ